MWRKPPKGSIGNECVATPIKLPDKTNLRACSTLQGAAIYVDQALSDLRVEARGAAGAAFTKRSMTTG